MGNDNIIIREANRVKYLRQFGIILAVTCAGEIMKYFIPLEIPDIGQYLWFDSDDCASSFESDQSRTRKRNRRISD